MKLHLNKISTKASGGKKPNSYQPTSQTDSSANFYLESDTDDSRASQTAVGAKSYSYNHAVKLIYHAVYQDLLAEESFTDTRTEELIIWHINKLAPQLNLSLTELSHLKEDVFNRLRRLGILQPFLDDAAITEIMVNGPEKIFYERGGKIYRSSLSFNSREELNNMLISYYSRHNVNLSISNPAASLRLPDGSRAHAVIAPVAPDGPIFTIRKFTGVSPNIDELIANNFITPEIATYLEQMVVQKQAIMIGGGTGTGKTTLLNILSAFIPSDERIISIEDSSELQLQDKENWVKLISREDPNNPQNSISINDLIYHALRMRPDRIIIGEVRGPEAYAMLKAAQTGHPGTLCTIHANDCAGMVYRLADLTLDAVTLPYETIIKHIISSFDILIHIRRNQDGLRYIDKVAELKPADNSFTLKYIYDRE